MGNKRRERQKARKKEEYLNSKDEYGNRDRTPQEAVANIIRKRMEINK